MEGLWEAGSLAGVRGQGPSFSHVNPHSLVPSPHTSQRTARWRGRSPGGTILPNSRQHGASSAPRPQGCGPRLILFSLKLPFPPRPSPAPAGPSPTQDPPGGPPTPCVPADAGSEPRVVTKLPTSKASGGSHLTTDFPNYRFVVFSIKKKEAGRKRQLYFTVNMILVTTAPFTALARGSHTAALASRKARPPLRTAAAGQGLGPRPLPQVTSPRALMWSAPPRSGSEFSEATQ